MVFLKTATWILYTCVALFDMFSASKTNSNSVTVYHYRVLLQLTLKHIDMCGSYKVSLYLSTVEMIYVIIYSHEIIFTCIFLVLFFITVPAIDRVTGRTTCKCKDVQCHVYVHICLVNQNKNRKTSAHYKRVLWQTSDP